MSWSTPNQDEQDECKSPVIAGGIQSVTTAMTNKDAGAKTVEICKPTLLAAKNR